MKNVARCLELLLLCDTADICCSYMTFVFLRIMFTTSTQRKYWTFHEQAELEQLREEVNHQYVSKNGGGDLDTDVCFTVEHSCAVEVQLLCLCYSLL